MVGTPLNSLGMFMCRRVILATVGIFGAMAFCFDDTVGAADAIVAVKREIYSWNFALLDSSLARRVSCVP